MTKLFPKRSRSRASLLLHYALKHISLDENERVRYGDGSSGSHIVDLVRYFVNPPAMHIERPIDALKFAMHLRSKGVPEAAFARHVEVASSKVHDTSKQVARLEPKPRHRMKPRKPKPHIATKHANVYSKWVKL